MPPVSSRLLAAAVATACAGCGSSAPVRVPGDIVRLSLTDYRIDPRAAEIGAGRVVLDIRNDGAVAHRLALRGRDGTPVVTSPPLPPGARARVTVTLQPGRYTTTDPLGRNDTLGARGELTVRADRLP